jgi:hypothetical protein
MEKKILNYKGYDCKLVKREYQEGGSPALCLEDPITGEPIAVATINVPELELPKDVVVIKDYSENEGMLDFLIQNKIVEEPMEYIPLGFILAPICKLLV